MSVKASRAKTKINRRANEKARKRKAARDKILADQDQWRRAS